MSDNFRGMILMLVSMALFAVEDMFLKFAAQSLPIGQIVFASGLFGAVVFTIMARRQGARVLERRAFHPAVLARALGEMVGTLGYIIALASVPLSSVSAVLQALPLTVTMAAALFLSERVGWRRWSAIAVGLAGVLLVIRPGMDGFRPEALWVLLTVAGLALRDLATRVIPPDCSTAQVSTWGLWAVTFLGALMMIPEGVATLPGARDSAMLLGALIFGTGGYWAIVAASRTGEVAFVAPFRYVRLVFAIAIGTVVFAEIPDAATLAGATLIVGSGLYSLSRERARARAAA